MRALVFLLAVGMIGIARGQLLDSIAGFAQEPPRPILRLDLRGSFVSNHNVRIAGFKLGLEHARRFQYGLGYNFLFTRVERDRLIGGIGAWPTRLHLFHVSAYVDYAFFQRGPWEVRIPVQVGVGRGSIRYQDPSGQKHVLYRSGLVLYEPGMTVQYRFLTYFGATAGWGFRLVMRTRHSLDERLTAPIYTLGLRIFFDDLYKDFVRPER
ncbi:MAG: hypothetical protein IT225_03195 [Flavobacteriales bacterium]|jgi:hypothetical protein|nr:hypothetical protein [Flavobacteriales bacterium]